MCLSRIWISKIPPILGAFAADIEDASHNITRLLAMARERIEAGYGTTDTVTNFVFAVRNVPEAESMKHSWECEPYMSSCLDCACIGIENGDF